MKTIMVAYRVSDLGVSLPFYAALGYVEVGRVEGGDGGRLVILKFPEEAMATLELVHHGGDGPVEVGNGFDHLAIQVDALADTLEVLTKAGLQPGPVQFPGGSGGPKNVVAHRPGWLPDRVGGVAARPSRRHHRGRLRLRRSPCVVHDATQSRRAARRLASGAASAPVAFSSTSFGS